jgi:hypothetical protein
MLGQTALQYLHIPVAGHIINLKFVLIKSNSFVKFFIIDFRVGDKQNKVMKKMRWHQCNFTEIQFSDITKIL